MKFRFIWPGKTKDEHLRALVQEYLRRLQRFVRCEVIETREIAGAANLEKESARIIEALAGSSLTILLDVNGREWSSHDLAAEVQRWENDSVKEIAVVIGGPNGVSPAVGELARQAFPSAKVEVRKDLAGYDRIVVIKT